MIGVGRRLVTLLCDSPYRALLSWSKTPPHGYLVDLLILLGLASKKCIGSRFWPLAEQFRVDL